MYFCSAQNSLVQDYGKGAAVIFDDVDVVETADKLVKAITFHTGQVCCDATRWLIVDGLASKRRHLLCPADKLRIDADAEPRA